jgi:hypothetical protein
MQARFCRVLGRCCSLRGAKNRGNCSTSKGRDVEVVATVVVAAVALVEV